MSKKRLLVLYYNYEKRVRKTIIDHLFCYDLLSKQEAAVVYHNVLGPLPRYLEWCEWDGIILHYTLLAERWNLDFWRETFVDWLQRLKHLKGVKIAIPQDEYANSAYLCALFKEHGVETVFTCAAPIDYQTLYPQNQSGLKHYRTVLTGYINEKMRNQIRRLAIQQQARSIDIGYRCRRLPYWLGQFGQIKAEIGDRFAAYQNQTPLKMDISSKPQDVFYGNGWLKFLLNCRIVLGTLGGASLHDPLGEVRSKVEKYCKEHPEATFAEVERDCFPGQDGALNLFALSPRHFECALTKTCQVLLEGEYAGIFKPGVHYIEVKKDYSNLAEVLKRLEDKKYCEEIAERTYREIACSDKYTYRAFAREALEHVISIGQLRQRTVKDTLCFYAVSAWARLQRLGMPLLCSRFRKKKRWLQRQKSTRMSAAKIA